MTVQDMIDELVKVEDKSMKIVVPCPHGDSYWENLKISRGALLDEGVEQLYLDCGDFPDNEEDFIAECCVGEVVSILAS